MRMLNSIICTINTTEKEPDQNVIEVLPGKESCRLNQTELYKVEGRVIIGGFIMEKAANKDQTYSSKG